MLIPYANNKGEDQPAHPRSLISAFVVRCLDRIIPLLAIAEISRPYLVSEAAQASLSLAWSKTPKKGFLVTSLINILNVRFLKKYLIPVNDCNPRPWKGTQKYQRIIPESI